LAGKIQAATGVGSRVAILVPNSLDALIALFGEFLFI
jgi:acyl-CoA synthetase (AMP-forming)/AMP-acid ligase II